MQLLVTLLRALADLAEPGGDDLPAGLRGHLMPALDSGADLDMLFGVLADGIEEARRGGMAG